MEASVRLRPVVLVFLVVLAAVPAGRAALAAGPALDREARISAAGALARVRHAHLRGSRRSFEEAVPRQVLAARVDRALRMSAALEACYGVRITREMLDRELVRMARDTRMPARLAELHAALGHDPLLLRECLARPLLAERLLRRRVEADPAVREMLAARGLLPDDRSRLFDAWWREVGPTVDPGRVTPPAGADAPLPEAAEPDAREGDGPPDPEDAWRNGSLDDMPDPIAHVHGAWTGTEFVAWGTEGGGPDAVVRGYRYDPATDAWRRMNLEGGPGPRVDAAACWTGERFVVWGGRIRNEAGDWTYLGDGYAWDPETDRWEPLPAEGAPTPRARHTAVWSGREVIVWGGWDGTVERDDGAAWDPETNRWRPTSVYGPPSPRYGHTAVVTGKEMIVWGGIHWQNRVADGKRLDLETWTWKPMRDLNAPEARTGHTAVWTGHEMVVWGGLVGDFWSPSPTDTGGRYDPELDAWFRTTVTGAPMRRAGHVAAWTGTEMIVWGGSEHEHLLSDGGRYDPATDSWAPMAEKGAPRGREAAAAAWTGETFLVWGGEGGSNTGGRYDPAADRWTPTFAGDGPAPRSGATATWSGVELLVWGGHAGDGEFPARGWRYDPTLDAWTPMTTEGAPVGREEHVAVFTGDRLLVWGGRTGQQGEDLGDGAAWDPEADRWEPLPVEGAPSPRHGHAAAWTGDEFLVWGGEDRDGALGDGARWDPETGTWRPMATAGAPSPRSYHAVAWTGDRMIAWGGRDGDEHLGDGALYDPEADAWSPMSTEGAPSPRSSVASAWTGTEWIAWGGFGDDGELHDGAIYDPAADRWRPMSTEGAPACGARWAAWGANLFLSWGGRCGQGTGAGRYDPVLDLWQPMATEDEPVGRTGHTVTWADDVLLVWGGHDVAGLLNSGGAYDPGPTSIDDDGDGLSELHGDCDDADPGVLREPGEVGGVVFAADKVTLSWASEKPRAGEATVYDLLEGAAADPVGDADECRAEGLPDERATIDETPAAGEATRVLVRARNACGTGTWGADSAGSERTTDACP